MVFPRQSPSLHMLSHLAGYNGMPKDSQFVQAMFTEEEEI